MEEKLKQEFVLASYGGLGEGRLLELLVALATKLKLVERTDGRLQVQMTRVKAWERKDVLARVKRIFEAFLKEHTRDHYSFHQKFLREIALEELGNLEPRALSSRRAGSCARRSRASSASSRSFPSTRPSPSGSSAMSWPRPCFRAP